jgi:hypothetical protein
MSEFSFPSPRTQEAIAERLLLDLVFPRQQRGALSEGIERFVGLPESERERSLFCLFLLTLMSSGFVAPGTVMFCARRYLAWRMAWIHSNIIRGLEKNKQETKISETITSPPRHFSAEM